MTGAPHVGNAVRPKHNIQDHHRSEAPACHRCGLPLLHDAEFCPYCERFLDEGRSRAFGRRLRLTSGPRVLGIPQRLLLAIGVVAFGLAAILSAVLALTS